MLEQELHVANRLIPFLELMIELQLEYGFALSAKSKGKICRHD